MLQSYAVNVQHSCYIMTASELLEQPCSKSYNAIKLVRSCWQLVPNLLRQTRNKECEHNLLTTWKQACNNLCVFTRVLLMTSIENVKSCHTRNILPGRYTICASKFNWLHYTTLYSPGGSMLIVIEQCTHKSAKSMKNYSKKPDLSIITFSLCETRTTGILFSALFRGAGRSNIWICAPPPPQLSIFRRPWPCLPYLEKSIANQELIHIACNSLAR